MITGIREGKVFIWRFGKVRYARFEVIDQLLDNFRDFLVYCNGRPEFNGVTCCVDYDLKSNREL